MVPPITIGFFLSGLEIFPVVAQAVPPDSLKKVSEAYTVAHMICSNAGVTIRVERVVISYWFMHLDMRNIHKSSLFALATVFITAALPASAQLSLAGVWADRITEDNYERSGGPPLGDYQGIPLSDAGRMKADSHDHSEWSLPEFQCRPHPGPYQWRALGAVRISEEIDPVSRELAAYHLEYLRSLERLVYMDGRPHPPAYAPHSWSGFSTGKWEGNMLHITTSHLKGAYLRRNGASFSDKSTMEEFITRHGNYMVITMIVTDPVWLEEPFIQTTHYEFDPATALSYYPCTVSEESISTEVPHFLPGENPNLMADDIPAEAARGGAASTRPEYRKKFKGYSNEKKK